MNPNDVWNLTYSEICDMSVGYNKRRKQFDEDLTYIGWVPARLVFGKKVPDFNKLISHEPTKKQTPEDMIAVAKLITIALGGEVVETC